MAGPLLETKLHVLRRRQGTVDRPRLRERLTAGATTTPLTLVSAPAGFGKSTLLGDWLAGLNSGSKTSWLSLDERDNDVPLFLRYVVAALQQAVPSLGGETTALLASGQ